jgi:hypothetical protein
MASESRDIHMHLPQLFFASYCLHAAWSSLSVVGLAEGCDTCHNAGLFLDMSVSFWEQPELSLDARRRGLKRNQLPRYSVVLPMTAVR